MQHTQFQQALQAFGHYVSDQAVAVVQVQLQLQLIALAVAAQVKLKNYFLQ
jgi:hypothetical protein